MAFDSVEKLLAQCENAPLWAVVRTSDCLDTGLDEAQSFEKMSGLWQAMKAALLSYDGAETSPSGLCGGDGEKLSEYAPRSIGGEFIAGLISNALKMGECNACMKRIVAAPTAGSCGVLPAALVSYAAEHNTPDEEIVKALYTAAGFGQIIAERACISGAEGGCQAEIGAASAMTAAALVFLHGGSAQMCAEACAMALKNLLGLVCDPVAGLVEVPCVKRNAMGVMNALCTADMALAGIKSHIPADEVIDALRSVGASLSSELRETGKGGLAATPTAERIKETLHVSFSK